MSVIGVNFGNDSCIIGLAQRGGVDIILNENSNRKNPTMVSFQGKQRYTGEGALSIAKSNYKNTVRDLKLLIGRKWGEPELMELVKKLPFSVSQHPKTGGVAITVNYNDEQVTFTPEQVISMMLFKVMSIARQANSDVPVADVVLSIPGWWTDSMRRAMLDACQITGMNTLRLMHESTATALAYGIYKSAKGQFDKEKPSLVLFLDMGHSGFSASVVSFVSGGLTVKSAAYDRTLGGREVDWAVAEHFAKEFKQKHGKDPMADPKSRIKLLETAEKSKISLSPIGVTDVVVNIECLVEETDYHGRLSVETLEGILAPLVERSTAPTLKALTDAGVKPEELSSVEIVGGALRVPAFKRHLGKLLNLDPNALNFGLSSTLNADESVARGCTLQAAILSSRFKVKEFFIQDAQPYPIRVQWSGGQGTSQGSSLETEDAQDEVTAKDGADSLLLFQRNEAFPKAKTFSLTRKEAFSVSAAYDSSAELPSSAPREIAEWQVDVPKRPDGVPSRVRLQLKLDIHGTINMVSAAVMEEIVEPDLPPPSAEDKKDTSESKMDVDQSAGEDSQAKQEGGEQAKAAAGGASADAKGEEGESKKKRKFRKVEVPVDARTASWSKKEIDLAVEKEAEMAQQDRIIKETADKRNELESYIYAMRDKLTESLKSFITEKDSAEFSKQLEGAEEWLYSDEGFDSTKKAYQGKLSDLQALGNPVEQRLYEHTYRSGAASNLTGTIEMCKKFANSSDEQHAHITEEERAKVRDEANAAESWLFEQLGKQGDLPPTSNPVLTTAQIEARATQLNNTCRPVMNKPKPAPKPKEEEKAAEPTEGEAKAAEGKEGGDAQADAKTEQQEGGPTPMDTDDAKAQH